jgi:hypothetical protein
METTLSLPTRNTNNRYAGYVARLTDQFNNRSHKRVQTDNKIRAPSTPAVSKLVNLNSICEVPKPVSMGTNAAKEDSSSSFTASESDSDSEEERRIVQGGKPSKSLSVSCDYEAQAVEMGNMIVETSDTSSSTASDSDCDVSYDDGDRRKVQFSNVSIRTYSLTVGEAHVKKSYPLSLDWAHTATKTIDIEMFEERFAAAQTKPQTDGRMVRGFRLPARLRTAQRLNLLATVTGQTPEDLYALHLARLAEESETIIPYASTPNDDRYGRTRLSSYEIVDTDDYQMVDL